METMQLDEDSRYSRVEGVFAAVRGLPRDEQIRILHIVHLMCGFGWAYEPPEAEVAK